MRCRILSFHFLSIAVLSLAVLSPEDARSQSTQPDNAAVAAPSQEQGATELPALDVTAKANKTKKSKPQVKQPSNDATAAAPKPPVVQQPPRETATGPVDGYAATQSATATKTDTPIIETPQSISIVTADQIKTMKAKSLAEALAYTPGIVQTPGYSNSFDDFLSRGFSISVDTGNIYRDGLKLGGSTGWAIGQEEPFGLERVEVLKGAASVLFGAASPGGVLNTVSKRPQREAFQEYTVEGGNYDHAAVTADINVPLGADWAFRMVALARDSDTWVDFVPNDALYFAPSLMWTPSDRTTVTFLAHIQERDTRYIYGVPVEGSLLASPYGKIPRERFVGEPGWDKQHTERQGLTYLLSHEFSNDLTLRQGVRYLHATNDVPFTGQNGWNGSAQMRTAYDNRLETEGVSADTSLEYKVATGPLQHTFISGLDYSHFDTHNRWWFGSVGDLDLFNPVYGSPVGPMTYYDDFGGIQSRIGVYAQDQIKIGNLNLLFGGRHDWATDDPYSGQTEKNEAFTGRAGAVYIFDNGFAPFVSFSQSFEPQLGLDDNGNSFEPTRGEQVEAGIRWQSPNERFLASVAVYDLVQTNVVSTLPNLMREQTGEVLSRGFEFEAKGEVAEDWTIIASYAYTHSITSKDENPAIVGKERPDVPPHTAALWVEHTNAWVDGLTVGVGARFVGETQDWEGTEAKVPAFVTIDALLAYDYDFWRLALNGSNIFDEETIQCSYANCLYGDGRRVTVSLSRRW